MKICKISLKCISASVMMFLFCTGGFAQRHGNSMQRIDSAKSLFINSKLLLTKEQSALFWPAYRVYQFERKKKRQSIRSVRNALENVNATEEQLKNNLKLIFNLRKDEIELESNFQDKLLTFLSARQIVDFIKAEKEFVILLKQRANRRE